MKRSALLTQLEVHEGFRDKPYKDIEGNLTIGFGRNLDSNPLSYDEALYLLENDIDKAVDALKHYTWYQHLSDVRQRVVVDMVFNLGIAGFARFKKTIGYIEAGKFKEAATEMLDSKWAQQVGVRAKRLSKMMATDIDEDFS